MCYKVGQAWLGKDMRDILKSSLYLGKIKEWGFCTPECEDTRTTFTFANLNILNNEECGFLIKYAKTKEEDPPNWNKVRLYNLFISHEKLTLPSQIRTNLRKSIIISIITQFCENVAEEQIFFIP